MDFEQIRAFLTVAALKSFSEAGERLYISQSSISIRIKALEEELNVTLFDRSKAKEPTLTEAGKEFLDYAQAIINLQDECLEKLSNNCSKDGGQVIIGASTVPGTYMLPNILVRFKTMCPQTGFNIEVTDTGDVLDGVLSYRYDLGFVGLVKNDDRLRYHPIGKDQLVFCISKGLLDKDYLTAGIPASDLQKYNLIFREKGSATRKLLEKQLEEKGLLLGEKVNTMIYNSLEGIKQAVKKGLGASVLSSLSVQDMVRLGEIETCHIRDLNLKRELYLVYHHRRILNEAAIRFKSFLVNA